MSSNSNSHPPEYELSQSGRIITFRAKGSWTLRDIGPIDEALSQKLEALDYDAVHYDVADVSELDTAGAYMFARAVRTASGECHEWEVIAGSTGQRTLVQAAADAVMGRPPEPTRQWYDSLTNMGRASERFFLESIDTIAFIGQFFVVLFKMLLRPRTIRWKSVVALTEEIGLNAAPIVMTLCFFIGAVIAYLGANLLSTFGASVFMVDLVGVSVLRELAPIITAILIAGRSDSAFTAQIGAMKMRQEIDAMTVLGLDTFEVLVVPRALACLISLPILTFLGMMSGIFAGMLIAWLGGLDISPILFFARLNEVVELKQFWIGMAKTPFFAIIIALIGCRQGLAVTGSVDSLGARTTTSVVQAIFAVIAVDAVFALFFFQMGI
ncbi:MlaE family ABC transporter permease [Hellea balneolensis]|uniref:MlaE family ABC transporter permease n=1 Tax=Hellea balneolensis TaxID=287478 RepID=UPI0003FA26AC|nr:ABC transporter permease [Hellea balneolensis]